jgi:hypothetical protein
LAWKPTPQAIAALELDRLKTYRENALHANDHEVVELCDAELARRKPPKVNTRKVPSMNKDRLTIHGIHFVCPTEVGVTRHDHRTASTGIWVVDEDRLYEARKVDAYVALHKAKSNPSYLQGIIKDWRVLRREGKTEFGIEFDLELTGTPLQWHGNGTGERGYYYGHDNPLPVSDPD